MKSIAIMMYAGFTIVVGLSVALLASNAIHNLYNNIMTNLPF